MKTNDALIQDIRKTVAEFVESGAAAENIAEEVFRKLDEHKMMFYQTEQRISLFNSHGRVLLAIIEDPAVTQRALSVYLNVSESNINKSLRMLLADGLIEKTRVKGRNRYQFNLSKGLSHPDISRFAQSLLPLVEMQAKQQKPHHS
jgi:predicted HTH transcriptional regulator